MTDDQLAGILFTISGVLASWFVVLLLLLLSLQPRRPGRHHVSRETMPRYQPGRAVHETTLIETRLEWNSGPKTE